MSPPRRTRRSVLRLGAAGLVVSVAGCATTDTDPGTPRTDGGDTRSPPSPSPSPSDPGSTLSMGETATSRDGVSVTVSDPRLRRTVLTPDVGSSVHAYPAGETDAQFLCVAVSTSSGDASSLDLAPVIGGTRHESRTYRRAATTDDSASLAFRIPTERARGGAVEWRSDSGRRYRWTLPSSVAEDLGVEPRFDVTRFAVPDAISRGDPFSATLGVTNRGDRDGRFLAVVLDEGASSVPLVSPFTVDVPAGEAVSRDLSGRELDGERSSATAILDWGIDDRRASVALVD